MNNGDKPFIPIVGADGEVYLQAGDDMFQPVSNPALFSTFHLNA